MNGSNNPNNQEIKAVRTLVEIYQNPDGSLDFSHEQMSVGSILALIGYLERIKLTLLDEIEEVQDELD